MRPLQISPWLLGWFGLLAAALCTATLVRLLPSRSVERGVVPDVAPQRTHEVPLIDDTFQTSVRHLYFRRGGRDRSLTSRCVPAVKSSKRSPGNSNTPVRGSSGPLRCRDRRLWSRRSGRYGDCAASGHEICHARKNDAWTHFAVAIRAQIRPGDAYRYRRIRNVFSRRRQLTAKN